MPTETRTLDELLSLDTYQGMSDAEIETLIEYRAEQMRADALYEEQRASYDALATSLLERAASEKNASDIVMRNAFDAANMNPIVVHPINIALEGVTPHVEQE